MNYVQELVLKKLQALTWVVDFKYLYFICDLFLLVACNFILPRG